MNILPYIKEELTSFFYFLKYPYYPDLKNDGKFRWYRLGILFLIPIFLLPFYKITKYFVETHFEIWREIPERIRQLLQYPPIFVVAMVSIFGPVLEELIFRLFLTTDKKLFSLWVTLIGLFIGIFGSHWSAIYIGIPIVIMGFCLMQNLIIIDANKIKVYFPYIFYISATIFAIVHLDIATIHTKNAVSLPILILYSYNQVFMQFLVGLILAYIRVKEGLGWAILYHGSWNALLYILFM
jgi:hypothetical protein